MPIFDSARDRILKSEIDFNTVPLKVLLKSGLPADLTLAQTLEDITVGERVATQDLVNQVLIPGANPEALNFEADNVVFNSVIGGQVNQAIIYIDGPSEGESPLVWARNVFFTPSGVNIRLNWGTFIFTKDCQGANPFYLAGKQLLYSGGVDLTVDEIHAVLLDPNYVVDLIAHTTLSDIPIAQRVGVITGYDLADKRVGLADALNAGVFDADDVVIASLTGADVVAVVLIKFNAALPETSELINFMNEGMNIPFTPDGTLTGVVWSPQDQRIIKI